MSYITIPSILHPKERAYKLDSSTVETWNKRGNAALAPVGPGNKGTETNHLS